MTIKQIETRRDKQVTKHDTAARIRALLDEAKKQLGDDYDETEIIELVTEE